MVNREFLFLVQDQGYLRYEVHFKVFHLRMDDLIFETENFFIVFQLRDMLK